jgi:hypothetical protein
MPIPIPTPTPTPIPIPISTTTSLFLNLFFSLQGYSWSTASLDNNITGDRRSPGLAFILNLPEEETYSWNKCFLECKAPCRKVYEPTDPDNPDDPPHKHTHKMQGFPKDYIGQVNRQGFVARSQRGIWKGMEGFEHTSTFPEKEYAFLAVLEVPYKKKKITWEEQPEATRVFHKGTRE